jgi:tetratricopeptide (TPR) repeat protein
MHILRLTQSRVAEGRYHIDIDLERPNTPRRTARGEFAFALDEREQAEQAWYLERYLQYPLDPAPKQAAEIERRMEAVGTRLFRELFQSSEDGRTIWSQIYERLNDLRVEIVTDVHEAATIPWELLRDPQTAEPLALVAQSFVRSTPAAARAVPLPPASAGPLRVLLVISRPAAGDDVPFRSVASRLLSRLGPQARESIELTVLRPPTFAELGRVLRAARDEGTPYQVLHFDGHGTYQEPGKPQGNASRHTFHDTRTGKHGYLLFEQPGSEGNSELISGPQLGRLLFEAQVPVLVLNACRSAYAESEKTPAGPPTEPTNHHEQVRAYGSLAQEVMDAGVAGVVAMRYNVYVVTAAQYVAELYAYLAGGRSLGAAATLARKHLADAPLRTIAYDPLPLQDWIVPVVYEAAPLQLAAQRNANSLQTLAGLSDAIGATNSPWQSNAHNLPNPPEIGFFGRDETLLALDRAFDTERIVLLHAYAGNGKTSTAAEFARWYQHTNGVAGPIIFTSFERHLPLERALDGFGQCFGGLLQQNNIDWSGLDDQQKRRIALAVMRQFELLWIWDNIEPVAGFPADSESSWSHEEQAALKQFLVEASQTQAKFLLTSRRDEQNWLGELPRRIKVPPMPMQERTQLASQLAERRGVRMSAVADWLPLLEFSGGNPMTITVVVGQAIRDGIRTAEQIERYVLALRTGTTTLADDESEGRERSLGASLSYGFANAFSPAEHRVLALLHLFQGFVDVDALVLMGRETIGDLRFLREYGLDRQRGIALLDRAAEVGLLEPYGGGYYRIHPALPWYFRDLFESEFPAVSLPGHPSARRVQRAYVEAMGILGNYYHHLFGAGKSDVITTMADEEANLLQAWRLACSNGWWSGVTSAMQGLRNLYDQTGQRSAWQQLVAMVTPDFCDAQGDGPLPGREEDWALVIEYRIQIAREEHDLALAERLQQADVTWSRQRTAALTAKPAAEFNRTEFDQVHNLAVSIERSGHIQRERGEVNCVESYQESLRLYEYIGDQDGAANCAFNLGTTYKDIAAIRDLDQAELWYQRSLALHAEGDRLGRGRSVGQLGSVAIERFDEARKKGEDEEILLHHLNSALNYYQQVIQLLPSNAVNDLAVAHNQLGLIYRRAGDLERMRFHYDEAIRYFEGSGDLYHAGITRYNLAAAYYNDGQYERARRYAELALQNFARYGAGAAQQVAMVQALLAAIDQAMGNSPP